MSYCPECGEQVSKEDIFCPFCGISLKPIAPVEDPSMSETIVDMPPVVIDKAALDALTAKSGAGTPKVEMPIVEPPVGEAPQVETPTAETQNAPVAEKTETAEPIGSTETPTGYSAGNTSENWTMKTESVEIPAEQLEDIRSIPLPKVFGGDEPAAIESAPLAESAPETVDAAPPAVETEPEPVEAAPVASLTDEE